MAKINLVLKGSSEPKKIYYRYRPSRNFDINGATPFEINSNDWDKENQCWDEVQIIKGAKLAEVKVKNTEITKFNDNLNKFKINLSKHISENTHLRSSELKESIKNYVLHHYFAHKIEENKPSKNIPEIFIKLIDHYLELRSKPDLTQGLKAFSKNTRDSYITLKNKIIEFDKNLKVTDINNNFRRSFVQWLHDSKYAPSYQSKLLKNIKFLCDYAEEEYDVSREVSKWKIINQPDPVAPSISFTKEQISLLESMDLSNNNKLDNARDWLVISCYCALRVSDLMKLDVKGIENDEKLGYIYYIKETKTEKAHYIWLFPSVIKILEKRDWNFPKKISSQKYNDYIKEVCSLANFNEETFGAKYVTINNKKRKLTGMYPFYELVSSHIGRRTFATIYSPILGAEVSRKQTGHSSNEMLQNYITTPEKELHKQELLEFVNAIGQKI